MPTEVDWTVLELDGVTAVAKQVSASVARRHDSILGADDLEQEALIICASRSAEVRFELDAGGRQFLGRWLSHRLTDLARVESGRRVKSVSYEANDEELLARGW